MAIIYRKDNKEHSIEATVPLEYIALMVFGFPLLMTVPDWYITFEIIVTVTLVTFMSVAFAFIVGALIGSNKIKVTEPETPKPYWTKKLFLSWMSIVIILLSMLTQDMINMFSIFLIMSVANGVGMYMLYKQRAKN